MAIESRLTADQLAALAAGDAVVIETGIDSGRMRQPTASSRGSATTISPSRPRAARAASPSSIGPPGRRPAARDRCTVLQRLAHGRASGGHTPVAVTGYSEQLRGRLQERSAFTEASGSPRVKDTRSPLGVAPARRATAAV